MVVVLSLSGYMIEYDQIVYD